MTIEVTEDGDNHQRFGGEWYCNVQHASFEAQELERNDGDCPWCGLPVEDD